MHILFKKADDWIDNYQFDEEYQPSGKNSIIKMDTHLENVDQIGGNDDDHRV